MALDIGTAQVVAELGAAISDRARTETARTRELEREYAEAERRLGESIDRATRAAVEREEAAAAQRERELDSERDRIEIEGAQAKDASALYSELRGDRGGLGRAQYDSVLNETARERAQLARARQELAASAARNIASLQAEGEYEKAEKLMKLAQDKLSAVTKEQHWAAEYGSEQLQFSAKLNQWLAEFENDAVKLTGRQPDGELTIEARRQLASLGRAMLDKGMVPNAEQLEAMGISEAAAREYIAKVELEKAAERAAKDEERAAKLEKLRGGK